MDKREKYKIIVREVVTIAGELGDKPGKPKQTQFIFDDERGHYLLYFNKWEGENRTYGCFLHINVAEDGKIWVQYDGTDLKIAQEILNRGVPKADIVLGFHSPVRRPDTGFAVA